MIHKPEGDGIGFKGVVKYNGFVLVNNKGRRLAVRVVCAVIERIFCLVIVSAVSRLGNRQCRACGDIFQNLFSVFAAGDSEVRQIDDVSVVVKENGAAEAVPFNYVTACFKSSASKASSGVTYSVRWLVKITEPPAVVRCQVTWREALV